MEHEYRGYNSNGIQTRVGVVVSPQYNMYVEYHHNRDLVTVCNLDGSLKYNIYGPDWNSQENPGQNYYFGNAVFFKDKIITSYSGKYYNGDFSNPSQLIVFDLNGKYLQTLETDCQIAKFCIDNDNNRIILYMDGEMQFGYLELDGIV